MTKEEKEAREYEKFQRKVSRLTPYAHTKRMFSRMEAEKIKEEQAKKPMKKKEKD